MAFIGTNSVKFYEYLPVPFPEINYTPNPALPPLGEGL